MEQLPIEEGKLKIIMRNLSAVVIVGLTIGICVLYNDLRKERQENTQWMREFLSNELKPIKEDIKKKKSNTNDK